jgi:hypothetical protein
MSEDDQQQKIAEFRERFATLMESFKNNYMAHKQRPEDSATEELYRGVLSGIDQLHADIFVYQNSLERENGGLNELIANMDAAVGELREKHSAVVRELESTEGSDGAAVLMKSNFLETNKLETLITTLEYAGVVALLGLLYLQIQK